MENHKTRTFKWGCSRIQWQIGKLTHDLLICLTCMQLWNWLVYTYYLPCEYNSGLDTDRLVGKWGAYQQWVFLCGFSSWCKRLQGRSGSCRKKQAFRIVKWSFNTWLVMPQIILIRRANKKALLHGTNTPYSNVDTCENVVAVQNPKFTHKKVQSSDPISKISSF